jgi:predicted PurR-regulated permease PerM
MRRADFFTLSSMRLEPADSHPRPLPKAYPEVLNAVVRLPAAGYFCSRMKGEMSERELPAPKEAAKTEAPTIQPIKRPMSLTALSSLGLFIMACFYTFYFARTFFLPVALAWLLSMLLKPLVRLLARFKIPEALGSAVVLLSLLAALGAGLILLSDPAMRMLEEAPASFKKVEGKIRALSKSAEKMKVAAEEVEKKISVAGGDEETTKVEMKKPGLLDHVWLQAKGAIYMGATVLALLYFFLASGDIFMLKVIRILPTLKDKKEAVEMARETERLISQYLVSVTLVNLYEGTAIGIGLALIGMHNAVLWGVIAFLANYIPYIGAMIVAFLVSVAAFASSDSASHALLAPAIYLGVNFTDNFIAPYIMGKRLVLNPVVVFLSIMFWGWIWGLVGVLLAVPLVMTLKIFCDHNRLLAPFGEFLAGEKDAEPTGVTAGK